jgi:hypothetical protein
LLRRSDAIHLRKSQSRYKEEKIIQEGGKGLDRVALVV